MKRCPRCQGALSEVRAGGARVEGCASCGGVWFDSAEIGAVAKSGAGELLALEDQFLPGPGDAPRSGGMLCPSCAVALYEFEFAHAPGVRLDACPDCKGVWADDGELGALYARMTGAARPAPVADPHRAARQAAGLFAARPCPRCRAANPAAGLACRACGERLPFREVHCPNCDAALRLITHGTLRLNACPDCTGVWLDAGELSAAAELRPEELRRIQDGAAAKRGGVSAMWNAYPSLVCPRCCVGMVEQDGAHATGLRLDACEGCDGLWVGAGKLELLSRHYTASLTRRRTF